MTETSRPSAVRASNDAVAATDHARLPTGILEADPLDRAMLGAFAQCVRAHGGGAVADLGCGAGRTTAYLDGLGIRAFGVDLSPALVAVARRSYPGLRFEVGRTTSVDVADGVLGGVLARYPAAHPPPDEPDAVFAEFARVLAPGGYALVAFAAGEDRDAPDPPHGQGRPAAPDAYGTPPARLAELLAGAGLTEVGRLVRRPGGDEEGPQGLLLTRKPPSG
ncbi:class I SAM-dependent methyltransferase [Streptomyces sp. NPDC029003]|uniref:class I SAM-dependent methyltransferase n=1 Tax=Streptomyces sp. NPDC029003 TaxID=3155125 RepID=UPI0033C82379